MSILCEQSSTVHGREAADVFTEPFGGVTQHQFPLYDELRELGDEIRFTEALQGVYALSASDW
ncbi:hypothetical protein ACQP1G_17120 [Nocardia sp. CA-107356]|uniref:hypothetical protein n=1 Tax=Nocardia sp. CA-107356 TaxID=3239972 RepID=UPI003D92484D